MVCTRCNVRMILPKQCATHEGLEPQAGTSNLHRPRPAGYSCSMEPRLGRNSFFIHSFDSMTTAIRYSAATQGSAMCSARTFSLKSQRNALSGARARLSSRVHVAAPIEIAEGERPVYEVRIRVALVGPCWSARAGRPLGAWVGRSCFPSGGVVDGTRCCR